MRERSLKALDAIIGELYVIDSKEELDQVYNGPNAVERLKASDAIIGELYVIDSKEELDQVYNGPNAVERLKDQIRFTSLQKIGLLQAYYKKSVEGRCSHTAELRKKIVQRLKHSCLTDDKPQYDDCSVGKDSW
ncbi:hypothetical protein RRG08_042161 [Elysia crispata]|uniref:Uncharacterized protein n=1 Tax=Elysia crispata TaxID=231223 RepID=A0AAE0Z6X1_9GAST|nr:hypothetical protein RRG08_042161 [Elysia crispata]